MSEDFLPRLVDSMFNRLVRPYAMDGIQEVVEEGMGGRVLSLLG